MGGFVKELGHVITHPLSSALHPIRTLKDTVSGKPAMPPPPPVSPTVDDATTASNQMQDMMRKRRGVYANIFGGNERATPTVATKQLLGT